MNYQNELEQVRRHCENSQKEIEALKEVLNEIDRRSLPEQDDLEKELIVLRYDFKN